MSESKTIGTGRIRRIRHRGRTGQVRIYLGKQLRFFINQSDWKVLPMAAVIAGLVAMVIRKKFFVNMEGSLIGAFALTCVAIWNGCFNSIQSVCRERPIIKREHRSGLHISSYVAAHMIYQLFLCTLQTGLTMYVLKMMDVQFPEKGFMTPWMIVDIGISMLLITYAADMMSLFLSSIARTTTGAMTLMPFVLIFQLVFSGGIIPLPAWSRGLSDFTISNYGIRAIAAQSGYNELPMEAVWNTVSGMKDTEIGGTFTVGELLDVLDSPAVEKRRDMEVLKSYTVGEAAQILSDADEYLHLRDKEVAHPFTIRELVNTILTSNALKSVRDRELVSAREGENSLTVGALLEKLIQDEGIAEMLDGKIGSTITLGQVLDALHMEDLVRETSDVKLNEPVTVGAVADFLKNNQALQGHRDRTITVKTTIGEVMDLFGEENVQSFIETKTAAAAYKEEYTQTPENIVENWLMLAVFILFFAFVATLALELIDKDKR